MIIANILRVTTAERPTALGKAGEFIVDMETAELFLGDGKTVGGVPTTVKARPLSKGLDELGVLETQESHHLITDDVTGEDESRIFLLETEDGSPVFVGKEIPADYLGSTGGFALLI